MLLKAAQLVDFLLKPPQPSLPSGKENRKPDGEKHQDWHEVQQEPRGIQRVNYSWQDNQRQTEETESQTRPAPDVQAIVAAPLQFASIELDGTAYRRIRPWPAGPNPSVSLIREIQPAETQNSQSHAWKRLIVGSGEDPRKESADDNPNGYLEKRLPAGFPPAPLRFTAYFVH
ncbi:MAG TPA: hypothetical protein VN924_32295 [Bryobacteraceae bacterium]|nr:hypothetical protein [Bryobacteraceae bacterium]